MNTPTTSHSERRALLLIGHFPPPVHGMAVAMEALAELLSSLGPVVRIRTVPRRILSRRLRHLTRPCRVSVAALRLISMRRRSSVAILSVDAGYGMVYTTALAFVARAMRYRVMLDHHSYAYVSQNTGRMEALLTVSGRSAVHIVRCESVRAEFERVYRRPVKALVISGAYSISQGTPVGRQEGGPSKPLILGHFGNLAVEKGLEVVLDFSRAAIAQGFSPKVVLAGRAVGSTEMAMLDEAVSAGYAEYRGSLSSSGKDAFFRDVDVFLFPSRYRNELAPAVVWEALLHGVPVIAYRAGCLTQEVVGRAGLVIDHDQNFVRAGLAHLEEWVRSPEMLAQARIDSVRRGTEERTRAIQDVLATGQRIFDDNY